MAVQQPAAVISDARQGRKRRRKPDAAAAADLSSEEQHRRQRQRELRVRSLILAGLLMAVERHSGPAA